MLQHAGVNAIVVANESVLTKLGTQAGSAKFVVTLSQITQPTTKPNETGTQATMPHRDDPATLIYTSGTTGEPKGILYTHGQLALACSSIIDALPTFPSDARVVCWLPLSNLFQRVMNLCAMASGASIYIVADPLKVLEFVGEIKPDVFIGVPRFYEKLAMGIKAKLAAESGGKAIIAKRALAIGERYAAAKRNGLHLAYRLSYVIV